MSDHLFLGVLGEDLSCEYLVRHNYEIRERNVRFKHDEIDIIAYDQVEKMIVFVEVKTRTRSSVAYPIETAVGNVKRHRLRRAISHWVALHDYDGPGRIDIICVAKDRVEKHLKDIGSDFF